MLVIAKFVPSWFTLYENTSGQHKHYGFEIDNAAFGINHIMLAFFRLSRASSLYRILAATPMFLLWQLSKYDRVIPFLFH